MTGATNGPVCGNCGKGVASDAVTCPHCGVLLAAYQVAGGSETLTIVMPESPDTTIPPSGPQPPSEPTSLATTPGAGASHRPASTSPIGDALRRSHAESQAELHNEPSLVSAMSDDLAAMAAGDDDLAAMADGDDDLASMAAGNDELSLMAGAGSKGSFEQAVDAELAGAKVVFEGGIPVIEAADVEVVAPNEGEPEVIEQPASPAATTLSPAATPGVARSPRPAPSERGRSQASRASTPPVEVVNAPPGGQQARSTGANPSRVPAAPSWQSIPGGQQQWRPQGKVKPDVGKMVGPLMAIPFLLIICIILGAGRGVGGFMLISVITMVIIIFLLVRVARLAVRKTSSMPRDHS